ncbi:MAG: hypothetical protein LBJ90_05555 [Treponema sp.]|jgi:hypothetical protein|nr:hypothetical protein [Treponema sp.]
MRINITGNIVYGLFLSSVLGLVPLNAADTRSIPIDVNLIVDGSSALKEPLDEVAAWISNNLVDHLFQEGDKVTIWSAGRSARIVYSDTLKDGAWKDNVKNSLKSLSAGDDSADFAGALREAAGRGSGGNMTYTLLVSGSSASLSPTLLGSGANLMKYSRIEEFRGWRILVIALNIDSRVRQAAAAYFSNS